MAPAACVVGVGDQRRTVPANPPAWLHQVGWPPRVLSKLPGGPGVVVIDGLAPGVTYEVWAAPSRSDAVGSSEPRQVIGTVTTLRPPPGRLLGRFASFTDLHVGEPNFGFKGRLREGPELGGPSAVLCLQAAVADARSWGAQAFVVRGDLTRSSHSDHFTQAADVVAAAGVPAVGVLGNHDVRRRSVDGAAISTGHGLAISTDVVHHDLAGIRLVLAHSPLPAQHHGDLSEAVIAGIAEQCGSAPEVAGRRPGPAAVVLHHPPDRRRWGSPHPPGVPFDQAVRLTAALRDANPATLILPGHRHRNRRYQVGGLTVSELGSTKDYPGSWAGFTVYEGGICQVVRRVSNAPALAWTEATGRGLFGFWQRWAPGTLEDRCWVQAW